jgi:pyruvate/oxaloacetate carboxyltransferase
MSADKMNIAEVYEMFETINNKLDKRTDKSTEATQIDTAVVNIMTERFEDVIKEVRKPVTAEYRDSVSLVHKQVKAYEKLVREQAERIEQAKVNETEAEKLKEEAEKLKKGK